MVYRPQYTIEINPNYQRRSGISRQEATHLLVALLVLSVAFTILYAVNRGYFSTNVMLNTLCWFAFSVLAVSCSFLVHELAHKVVAQRFGSWAEFRMFMPGLMLGLLMSLLGFLIAAPGAVMISGRVNEKENGLISLAGPASNAVMCLVFLALFMVTPSYIGVLFYLIANLNIILGIFNMIPFPPFDGSKIMRWSMPVYIVTVAVFATLFVLMKFI